MNASRILGSPKFIIAWLALMFIAVLMVLVGSIMEGDTSRVVAESMRVAALAILFRGLLGRESGRFVVRFRPTLLWVAGFIWVAAVTINLWERGALLQGLAFTAVVTLVLVLIQRARAGSAT